MDFALSGLDERATRTTRVLLSRVVDTCAPAQRRANFSRLAGRLGELRSPACAAMPPESSPLAFPIEVEDKPATVDRLAHSGIMGTLMWTTPHPAMSADRYPGAASLRARLVGLPVHQELDAADIDRIADTVAAVLAE